LLTSTNLLNAKKFQSEIQIITLIRAFQHFMTDNL
jgi:hypothetical protein